MEDAGLVAADLRETVQAGRGRRWVGTQAHVRVQAWVRFGCGIGARAWGARVQVWVRRCVCVGG